MKKILAITLITLGVLIAGGYTTSVYAEDLPTYYTQEAGFTGIPPSASSIAWGKGSSTLYRAECGGPHVGTMTHTFNYIYPCILVDVEDDHLEWTAYTNPGDYMIRWTNINASFAATGTSWYLHVTASDSKDVKLEGGTETQRIETYYALVDTLSDYPNKDKFKRAGNGVGEFDGELSGAPVQSDNGARKYYDKYLWARVTPELQDYAGKYEDVFYLTFQATHTP